MNKLNIEIAKNLVSYVDKHNSFPAKIEVNNVSYNYGTFTEILANTIVNTDSKPVNKTYGNAPAPKGDNININIGKTDYIRLAREIVVFYQNKKRCPNYVEYKNKKIKPQLFSYCFAKIIKFYIENKRLPTTCKFDTSVFKSKKAAPTIKPNDTWNYFVKKTGFKGNTIDEVLAWVKKHGKYQYYFDGHKTNKQVTDCKCGNCTDWLQWLINIAEALGYEWKCLHVKCIKSGTGHVRGQFKHSKHTGGAWINRDPASVADGGAINSIWCSNGTLQATNPSWFLETLRK